MIQRTCWRGEIDSERADWLHEAVKECPVELHLEAELGVEARRVASELGWAKTYDAEYVALAQMLGCQLVTLSGGLLEAAEELGL